MALQITDQWQLKYTNKWGGLIQQTVSRLEPYVTVKSGLSGKVVFFDQFGLLSFDEKTERMGKTKLDEAPTERRSMRPRIFSKAIGYDEFDGNQLADLDLPVSETIQGLRAAAGRKIDEVMIDSFLGTNRIGADGLDPVEIPSKQIVPVNYVESGSATDSGLTVAKLRKVLGTFMKNEAWGQGSENYGDQLVFACSAEQIINLLATTEVTSRDFSAVQALYEGKVDTFMGFKFLRTELLPKDGNNRVCLAWVKSKAQFGLWKDFSVKTSIRDDMEEALQIRAKFSCGATRLQEEGFVKVLCKEA